ncbi:hypothetical protein BHE74_00013790 [Ensete ventricosum]|nr:hypothetical protein BHE74_00013790 [Ensete ventricosum]
MIFKTQCIPTGVLERSPRRPRRREVRGGSSTHLMDWAGVFTQVGIGRSGRTPGSTQKPFLTLFLHGDGVPPIGERGQQQRLPPAAAATATSSSNGSGSIFLWWQRRWLLPLPPSISLFLLLPPTTASFTAALCSLFPHLFSTPSPLTTALLRSPQPSSLFLLPLPLPHSPQPSFSVFPLPRSSPPSSPFTAAILQPLPSSPPSYPFTAATSLLFVNLNLE